MKDTPADRVAPRARLSESLDAVFKKAISPKLNLDAVEPKLIVLAEASLAMIDDRLEPLAVREDDSDVIEVKAC